MGERGIVALYHAEEFTAEEADVLRRYFTNLDGPVFALVNLPEVVKGALFARYSRTHKSLRRLFLDEFVGELDTRGDATVDATVGLARAEALYQRVFSEYGDDSVAQLGGVHLACEQASNLLTKALEWGRLMAYLEQSTRYLAYDRRMGGRYRYHRPPTVVSSPLGTRYVADLDAAFATYSELLDPMGEWLRQRYPKDPEVADLAYDRSIRAKAFDSLRGLLPAAALSNVGIYGTGQSYELMIMRLRAHPLPEARSYAELMLTELRKVIPSFLARVDRPDRGLTWTRYLADTSTATASKVGELFETASDLAAAGESGNQVQLVDWDPQAEDKVLAAIAYPHTNLDDQALLSRVQDLDAEQRAGLLAAYVGERGNRRHRPGRALERSVYRFDVVCDYGAFRDLQRHRMLTIQWQPLTPDHGFAVPPDVEEAGLAPRYRRSMDHSAALHAALGEWFPTEASYAVALGYRIRFVIDINARAALHLLELRTQPAGHPGYRAVAQAMHRLIAEQAGHRGIAGIMGFVDHSSTGLERLESERRADARRKALG